MKRGAAVAGLAAAIVLAACGGSPPTDATPTPTPTGHPMLLGADISALERIEQGGAVFRDSGQARDAIAILRAHGADIFRLRVFVNPNGDEVQVNDLAYTIRMATRVRASGARLLLDLHYSDTWADPAHQVTPAAWDGIAFDSLERVVETYTHDVVAALRAASALPSIVQIGNEIDAGMLWPLGRVGGADDTPTQWDRLTRLLKAGVRGVRSAVDVSTDTVRIMLHYSQGASSGGTQWLFDHIAAASVDYDLIGMSYYPWWHGSLAALGTNLRATAQRYGRDVMIVETTYPWRAGGWESMAPDQSAMVWPVTPQGQERFLRDLIGEVAAVPDRRGIGVVWWYPEAVQVPGLFVWGGGSMALFDASGAVLPAASNFALR